ncbi:MAG: pilus assembly protein PilP [Desulfonatronovibrionaceae bacterium]
MKKSIIQFFCVCLLAGLLIWSSPLQARAQNASGDSGEPPAIDLDWFSPPQSHYTVSRDKDPFRPFMFKSSEEPEEDESRLRSLTPLERVEVSQLKLMGVLWYPQNPEKAKALVELPDGKGYMLRKGDRVGQNSGIVMRIGSDRVVIREEIENFLGETENKDTTLKVRTDEEEND